jgi:hypothetical protein
MPKNNLNDLVTDTGLDPGFNVSRDRVLNRLWDIANMDPERTRNSMSAQIKALSLIVAIEGLIPDRRAVSAQKPPAPPQDHSSFYTSEWLRNQQNGVDPQQPPAPGETAPRTTAVPSDDLFAPKPDPTLNLGEAAFSVHPLNPSQTPALPRVPEADYFAPDTRVSFSIPKKPFGRRYR